MEARGLNPHPPVPLLGRLQAQAQVGSSGLHVLDRYYEGSETLLLTRDRLRRSQLGALAGLSSNWCALAVDALAERLAVEGFRLAGETDASDDLRELWESSGAAAGTCMAITEALVHGRSYLVVWGDRAGRPTISVESALQMAVMVSPGSRLVTAALKQWTEMDEHGETWARLTLYLADEVRRLRSAHPVAPDGGDFVPAEWVTLEVVPNPLGVVPVVPVVNRTRLLGVDGSSVLTPGLLTLQDLIGKLVCDLVTLAESYSLPRRWATGVEVPTDAEGAPVDPFAGAGPGALFVVDDPAAKLGAFPPASLTELLAAITSMVEHFLAQASIPPHLALGAFKGQQVNAESVRAAESSLVAKARRTQGALSGAFEDALRLALLVRDGRLPRGADRLETVWASPESDALGAQADAAAKLSAIGVPLSSVLSEVLGWSPEQVAVARQQRRAEAVDQLTATVGGLLG